MNKSQQWGLIVAFILSVAISSLPLSTHAQSQPSAKTSSKLASDDRNSVVTVTTSVGVQVSNDSLKTKDGMLRSSVINFLNSGPNVLKTSQTDQPIVKSKIINNINNATQNVEGIDATNAIVGVEVGKALKTLVLSSDKPNQSALVTIQTSSTCKPATVGLISCENTVTIK